MEALYYLLLVVVTIGAILLGRKSSLLRDAITNKADFLANATALNIDNPKPPFSLARTQLAFWTVIVISSFLYAYFKHKFEVPDINNVNLILLGIAAATTASGKVIDDSQKQNPDLSQNYPSMNFFQDILSDKSGVSIHRLQNVLWTLVVGIIYIQYVGTQGNLPDETVISNNILYLMGISTGAYVGLKATENSK